MVFLDWELDIWVFMVRFVLVINVCKDKERERVIFAFVGFFMRKDMKVVFQRSPNKENYFPEK